jgi:O-antigen/teichoic acid export membrane protein
MGIVLKQSFWNTLVLILGFTFGGINILFLYTNFLQEDYFGLITFLLSTANIMLPLMVFGMHYAVIKYFSGYTTDRERDGFLISSLLFPLFLIIPIGLLGAGIYESLSSWLSVKNEIIKQYTYLIFLVALFQGYFEIFYAWSKVQLRSVFGNIVKELFARCCVALLLVGVYLDWLTDHQFIYAVVIVFGIRTLVMMGYALYLYRPKLQFSWPANTRAIVRFSAYILVSGSAAGLLLEIDKFMIPQMEAIAKVAYYSVGIYIASVVAIPTRAMHQITAPITAKYLNEGDMTGMIGLYKQSSLNLLAVGGLLFLLINLNISDMYAIIDKPEFAQGVWIVFIISVAKLIELSLGTGNAILVNSRYYKIFFYLSLAMAISVVLLNGWLIGLMGIDGAALATLIVVAVYSLIKLLYIKRKFKSHPFSLNTIKVLLITIVMYLIFSTIQFDFHPLINILLRSAGIGMIYLILVKWLRVSEDINQLIRYMFKGMKV